MELRAMCVTAPAISTNITFIHAEGLAMGDTAVADALKQIRQAIGELVSAYLHLGAYKERQSLVFRRLERSA